MKTNLFTLVVLFITSLTLNAQDVTGVWKTIDDESGEAKSHVEIYKKDGKVYGKVIKILNPDRQDATCIDCPGEDAGKPVEGLVIIKDLEKDDDEYTDGKILDPESGKLYKCYITLEEDDKLKVRGYIGFSLIGRTQYWHRVK
ncbi:DUF2147 domain-containing protein [Flavobacteriaceae bacterium TK19130]|nr:DUF2147 domain-containing protein [Thermobacterium salinum]